MEKLQIDSKFADQSGEIMVVELGGHVDQSNSYQLERLFDNIIESGCYRVIVDFSKVYYMSSAGWGVFVGEIKRFRDRGGDIKLANMNPDIYEVYQMLEFYHILDDYPSVEAAAAAFKKDQEEIDLVIDEIEEGESEEATAAPPETPEQEESIEEIDLEEIVADSAKTKDKEKSETTPISSTDFGKEAVHDFVPTSLHTDVKLADLPLPEKIKRVIAQNPLIGIWGIRKILRHEHFGRTKVGIFKLYKILRDLDLNTKAKRYRFYRSC
ncbi:STAS domain-containing protein [Calditrichota bacterium LG25]